MSLDQVISFLVAITLIEKSFATGLGVRLTEIIHAARDGWLLFRSGLVNYMLIPAAAIVPYISWMLNRLWLWES